MSCAGINFNQLRELVFEATQELPVNERSIPKDDLEREKTNCLPPWTSGKGINPATQKMANIANNNYLISGKCSQRLSDTRSEATFFANPCGLHFRLPTSEYKLPFWEPKEHDNIDLANKLTNLALGVANEVNLPPTPDNYMTVNPKTGKPFTATEFAEFYVRLKATGRQITDGIQKVVIYFCVFTPHILQSIS